MFARRLPWGTRQWGNRCGVRESDDVADAEGAAAVVGIGAALAGRAGDGSLDEHRRTRSPLGPSLIEVTVTGWPLLGSVESIVISRCSIWGMPRASTAHIAYTRGPPAMATTCRHGTGGERYAAGPRRAGRDESRHARVVPATAHPLRYRPPPPQALACRRGAGGGEGSQHLAVHLSRGQADPGDTLGGDARQPGRVDVGCAHAVNVPVLGERGQAARQDSVLTPRALSSAVEALASIIVIWRFTGPRTLSTTAERRGQRAVAVSSWLLAPYVAVEAAPTPPHGCGSPCCTCWPWMSRSPRRTLLRPPAAPPTSAPGPRRASRHRVRQARRHHRPRHHPAPHPAPIRGRRAPAVHVVHPGTPWIFPAVLGQAAQVEPPCHGTGVPAHPTAGKKSPASTRPPPSYPASPRRTAHRPAPRSATRSTSSPHPPPPQPWLDRHHGASVLPVAPTHTPSVGH